MELTLRILSVLALSTSLLACTDETLLADEEDAIVRAGEADFSAATARHVDPSASLTEVARDPLVVPLVVELYQDPNFRGPRRNIVMDEPAFAYDGPCHRYILFENLTTSVIVREGPDYAAWKASHGEPYAVLYDHPHFAGRRLVLGVGGYSDLRRHGFENIASSLKFTTGDIVVVGPDVASVTPMRPLTAVIEGHQPRRDDGCTFADPVLTLVRTSGDLTRDFGRSFNDTLSYVEIIPTTTFAASGELTVFEHAEFTGHGDGWRFEQRYVDLAAFGLDNKVSSYRRSF